MPNTYANGKIMGIAAPPQPRREMFSTKVKAQERSLFAMIDCISVIDCNSYVDVNCNREKDSMLCRPNNNNNPDTDKEGRHDIDIP